jgi:hypothetical protein
MIMVPYSETHCIAHFPDCLSKSCLTYIERPLSKLYLQNLPVTLGCVVGHRKRSLVYKKQVSFLPLY